MCKPSEPKSLWEVFTGHNKGLSALEVLVCILKGRTDTGYIIHVPKQPKS